MSGGGVKMGRARNQPIVRAPCRMKNRLARNPVVEAAAEWYAFISPPPPPLACFCEENTKWYTCFWLHKFRRVVKSAFKCNSAAWTRERTRAADGRNGQTVGRVEFTFGVWIGRRGQIRIRFHARATRRRNSWDLTALVSLTSVLLRAFQFTLINETSQI